MFFACFRCIFNHRDSRFLFDELRSLSIFKSELSASFMYILKPPPLLVLLLLPNDLSCLIRLYPGIYTICESILAFNQVSDKIIMSIFEFISRV